MIPARQYSYRSLPHHRATGDSVPVAINEWEEPSRIPFATGLADRRPRSGGGFGWIFLLGY